MYREPETYDLHDPATYWRKLAEWKHAVAVMRVPTNPASYAKEEL